MHELSVAESIMETIEQHAGKSRVSALTVEIGVLSGVFSESLQFYLDSLLEERQGVGAIVHLKLIPARFECDCGHTYEIVKFRENCPQCGGSERRVTGGRDCVIESIEVDDEA